MHQGKSFSARVGTRSTFIRTIFNKKKWIFYQLLFIAPPSLLATLFLSRTIKSMNFKMRERPKLDPQSYSEI